MFDISRIKSAMRTAVGVWLIVFGGLVAISVVAYAVMHLFAVMGWSAILIILPTVAAVVCFIDVMRNGDV